MQTPHSQVRMFSGAVEDELLDVEDEIADDPLGSPSSSSMSKLNVDIHDIPATMRNVSLGSVGGGIGGGHAIEGIVVEHPQCPDEK